MLALFWKVEHRALLDSSPFRRFVNKGRIEDNGIGYEWIVCVPYVFAFLMHNNNNLIGDPSQKKKNLIGDFKKILQFQKQINGIITVNVYLHY